MKFDLDILKIISNDEIPAMGKILISEPLLNDLYFSRSVVYLIDETADTFMGLVMNNSMDIKLHDVLEGFDDSDFDLYAGGPLDPDVLFYIHSIKGISGAEPILNGLYFGGDLDEIRKLTSIGVLNKTNIRFFLGSSSWGPGQLNEEISFNSWLITECENDFLFGCANSMWEDSLNFVGNRYKIWRNFPLDPELN